MLPKHMNPSTSDLVKSTHSVDEPFSKRASFHNAPYTLLFRQKTNQIAKQVAMIIGILDKNTVLSVLYLGAFCAPYIPV